MWFIFISFRNNIFASKFIHMRRTFLAVPVKLSKPLLYILQQLQKDFRKEKIRWVPPQNLHFTLAFLGATSEEDQQRVQQIITDLHPGSGSFEINLSGLSAFPSINKPRIIFTGVKNEHKLVQLQEHLTNSLKVIPDLYTDNKKFVPHLTLARVKFLAHPEKVVERLKEESERFKQVIHIHEITYFESILKPEGPQYVPIQSISLDKD